MATRKWYTEQNIQDIADAIRLKDGSDDKMLVEDMAERILALPSNTEVDELRATVDSAVALVDTLNTKVESLETSTTSINTALTTLTQKVNGLGTASTRNVGTASGNVPVIGVNGKLPLTIMPVNYSGEGGSVGGSGISEWGSILGDIQMQDDLVTYLETNYVGNAHIGELEYQMTLKADVDSVSSLIEAQLNAIGERGYITSTDLDDRHYSTVEEVTSLVNSVQALAHSEVQELTNVVLNRPNEDRVRTIVLDMGYEAMISDAITSANTFASNAISESNEALKDEIKAEVESERGSELGMMETRLNENISSAQNTAMTYADSIRTSIEQVTATKSELSTKASELSTQITTEVSNSRNDILEAVVSDIDAQLSGYYTKEETDDKLSTYESGTAEAIENVESRINSSISGQIASLSSRHDNELNQVRTDYATKDSVSQSITSACSNLEQTLKNYVDGFDHDHSPFISSAEADSKILAAVSDCYTKKETDDAIYESKNNLIQIMNGTLSDYVQTTDLGRYVQQSEMSLYARADDLKSYVPKDEMSGYATSSDVGEINTALESKVSVTSLNATLSDYVLKDAYILKIEDIESRIQSITVPADIVTQSDVQTSITNALVPINTALGKKADSSELSSYQPVGNYVTVEGLNNEISNNETVLSKISTTELQSYLSEYVRFEDSLTENAVSELVNSLVQADIQSINSELMNKANQSDVDEKLQNVLTESNWEDKNIGQRISELANSISEMISKVDEFNNTIEECSRRLGELETRVQELENRP